MNSLIADYLCQSLFELQTLNALDYSRSPKLGESYARWEQE